MFGTGAMPPGHARATPLRYKSGFVCMESLRPQVSDYRVVNDHVDDTLRVGTKSGTACDGEGILTQSAVIDDFCLLKAGALTRALQFEVQKCSSQKSAKRLLSLSGFHNWCCFAKRTSLTMWTPHWARFLNLSSSTEAPGGVSMINICDTLLQHLV